MIELIGLTHSVEYLREKEMERITSGFFIFVICFFGFA
jgi:hypothetical protein